MDTSTTAAKLLDGNNLQPSFWSILFRTIISHTVTYLVTGVVASILFGYGSRMVRQM